MNTLSVLPLARSLNQTKTWGLWTKPISHLKNPINTVTTHLSHILQRSFCTLSSSIYLSRYYFHIYLLIHLSNKQKPLSELNFWPSVQCTRSYLWTFLFISLNGPSWTKKLVIKLRLPLEPRYLSLWFPKKYTGQGSIFLITEIKSSLL